MNLSSARASMIDSQLRPNGVSDPKIVQAFAALPREAFVPADKKSLAYGEAPINLSAGRHIWSAMDTGRLIVATAPKPSDMVMILGAGTGYEAAVFAQLCEFVLAIEPHASHVERASDIMADLSVNNVSIIEAPLKEGYLDQSPFDIIYVCGAVEQIPPTWLDQLSEGGRLAVITNTRQKPFTAQIHLKTKGAISKTDAFECVVPIYEDFQPAPKFEF